MKGKRTFVGIHFVDDFAISLFVSHNAIEAIRRLKSDRKPIEVRLVKKVVMV